jgi:acetyltransferase-like isoleucine patch superfamily enzyme
MSLDATKIGTVVAEQMEALEARFGDDCKIGDVCTIVEVLGPHGSSVAVRPGSDVRPHGLIGLLRIAERVALNDLHGEPSGGE